MKKALLIVLVALSLVSSQAAEKTSNNATQKTIPDYLVDAKSFGLIDAKSAFFIINSRKYGVMKDHFAFAKEEDAKEYVKINGGEVLTYEEYAKELKKKK